MATVMTTTQLEQVHAAMAAVSERLQQALDAGD
jgi:hypothetical protein